MSTSRASADSFVQAVVNTLLNLHEGPDAIPEIVSFGEQAVPALEALLRGPSQAVYHSRCWAADALAAIGGAAATQALVRALDDSVHRDLPASSLEAEDTIVSCIAEHLGMLAGQSVVDALLSALQRRAYPGCVRALGRLAETRAIPLLIGCLFEDSSRAAAIEALLQLGAASVPAVAAALGETKLVHGIEPPTHIDGRVAAATLLGMWAVRAQALCETDRIRVRHVLRDAVHDRQRLVRVAAALSLLRYPNVTQDAVRVLIAALDEPDWRRATPLVHALVRLGPSIEGPLLEGIRAKVPNEGAQRRRRRAVWIAGQLRLSAAIPLLSSLTAPEDTRLRVALITALDRFAAVDAGTLRAYLDDPEALIRRRALTALRRRRAITAHQAAPLLGDADHEVRRVTANLLCECRGEAELALVSAVVHLGRPASGWKSRLRLVCYATLWLLSERQLQSLLRR